MRRCTDSSRVSGRGSRAYRGACGCLGSGSSAGITPHRPRRLRPPTPGCFCSTLLPLLMGADLGASSCSLPRALPHSGWECFSAGTSVSRPRVAPRRFARPRFRVGVPHGGVSHDPLSAPTLPGDLPPDSATALRGFAWPFRDSGACGSATAAGGRGASEVARSMGTAGQLCGA